MNNRGSVILGFVAMLLVVACLVGVFSMSAFSDAKDTPGDTTQDTNNDGTSGDDNTGNGGTSGDTNTNVPAPSKYQLYDHSFGKADKIGYRTIGTETWYFAVYNNPYFKNPDLDTEAYDISKWSLSIIEDNVTIYGDMNVIIKYSFDYGISWNNIPLVADDSPEGNKTIYQLDKIPSGKTVCISYTVVSNDRSPESTIQKLKTSVFTQSGFPVTTYNSTYPGVVVPAG